MKVSYTIALRSRRKKGEVKRRVGTTEVPDGASVLSIVAHIQAENPRWTVEGWEPFGASVRKASSNGRGEP